MSNPQQRIESANQIESVTLPELPADITIHSPIVDALAWQPVHVTPPRRAAILVWTGGYLATAMSFLLAAVRMRALFFALIGLLLILVAIRTALNAFPEDPGGEEKEMH